MSAAALEPPAIFVSPWRKIEIEEIRVLGIATHALFSYQVMERECTQSLHRDLIYQILSWASPGTLPVCQQVCTEWRSIIDDPKFRALHQGRGRARCTISGYFIDNNKSFRCYDNICFHRSSTFISLHPMPPSISPPSLDFLPEENIMIWCSSRLGLLCCESVLSKSKHYIPRYYICKPTTRQWREIPYPETEFFTLNVSMVVRSTVEKLDFKIVRLSIPRSRGAHNQVYIQCEIFESATWAWKRLRDIAGLYSHNLGNNPGVEIGGVLHWVLIYDYTSIFAFDVEKEDWKLIRMPQINRRTLWSRPMLVAPNGELCLLVLRRVSRSEPRSMDVWVMKKDSEKNILWERNCTKLLESEHQVRDLCSSNVAFLLSRYSKTIWFHMDDSKKLKELQLDWKSSLLMDVFKFESDDTPIGWGSRTESVRRSHSLPTC